MLLKNILFSFVLISATSLAQESSSPYQENLHYQVIKPAYATDENQSVIIYEFFSYKCPHCSNIQPHIKLLRSKLPSYAKIVGVPLGFQSSWKLFAQAFYTAQTMGVLEKSHIPMFDAVHKQGKKFRTIEDIAHWYASEFNIDANTFITTANSFMVDSMINKGNNIALKVEALRTPKLVINGKFMPDVSALGGYDALVDLTLQLVEQEAQSMGLK